MISPALAKMAPTHPAWSGALLFECDCTSADQASMILMAVLAYCASPENDQMSACVNAAVASLSSSVQPTSGLEYGPHSTLETGCGVYVSPPNWLAFAALNAVRHGSAPAAILVLTKSSSPWLTRTPGCRKTPVVPPPQT